MKQNETKLIEEILNEFEANNVTAHRDIVANKLTQAGVDVSTAYEIVDRHEDRRFERIENGEYRR